MACNVVSTPTAKAIICFGSKAIPQRCKFCDRPATVFCDWPVERAVKISHWRLAETDIVVTQQAGRHLPIATLQRFRYQDWQGLSVPVTMYGLKFPAPFGELSHWLYYKYGNDTVRVLRPATCDVPCCYAHHREIGENKDCCKEHWDSWKERM